MKKFLITALLVATGWLSSTPAMAVPTLSIQPATAATTVGGSVTVDLVISGLDADNEIASGFDLDIFFDPGILSSPVVTTNFAPWVDALLDVNFFSGRVEIILAALNDDATLAGLQGDSVLLSQLTFTGLADGFSLLNFGADPDFERNVVGRDALSLPLIVEGACIAVGTGTCDRDLPEPGTLALVLTGVGLVAWRRRRTV